MSMGARSSSATRPAAPLISLAHSRRTLMSDFLLSLGENPQAVRLIKTLGLPIPIPQKLRRADGPWEDRPLDDWTVVVGAAPGGTLGPVIASTLTRAGANPRVAS